MKQARPSTQTRRNALISVGSNVNSHWGDPAETVQKSRLALQDALNVEVVMSRLYQTPAFPVGAGPDFVNAVFALTASIEPLALLEVLHSIEDAAGRVRDVRWGPRVLDMDLLACDELVLPDLSVWTAWYDLDLDAQSREAPEHLILPHPRLQDRAFVLVPLADVAPTWVHPVLELSVPEMTDACFGEDLEQVVPIS